MIRAFHQEHSELSLSSLCEHLGVSRSWLYARPSAIARRTEQQNELLEAMEPILLEFPVCGYRTVTRQFVRRGVTPNGRAVNHKRVLRVMREEGLLCKPKRRFTATTDSSHGLERYPNLLRGASISRPHQAWLADITYVRLPHGFVYLAAVLDAYTRLCPGWALSKQIDTRLTLAALEKALANRTPETGWIHHSDQGVQYASGAYIERLRQAGGQPSMSRRGNPYDNAKVESFFKTLKREEVYLNQYRNFDEALANIGPFIDAVYNQKRLHSSLGYVPPAEFEADFHAAKEPEKEQAV